jgi:hypothetical protein
VLKKDAKWGERTPQNWNPQAVDADMFDPKKIFCLIGTDTGDYGLPR